MEKINKDIIWILKLMIIMWYFFFKLKDFMKIEKGEIFLFYY